MSQQLQLGILDTALALTLTTNASTVTVRDHVLSTFLLGLALASSRRHTRS